MAVDRWENDVTSEAVSAASELLRRGFQLPTDGGKCGKRLEMVSPVPPTHLLLHYKPVYTLEKYD